VSHDDVELREVGRYVVDVGVRAAVLVLDAVLSGLPGADTSLAGVEQGRYAEVADRAPELVVVRVVGLEGLGRRVELEALEAQLFDAALGFLDGQLPLLGVDAA
jgi:hypothetical protein